MIFNRVKFSVAVNKWFAGFPEYMVAATSDEKAVSFWQNFENQKFRGILFLDLAESYLHVTIPSGSHNYWLIQSALHKDLSTPCLKIKKSGCYIVWLLQQHQGLFLSSAYQFCPKETPRSDRESHQNLAVEYSQGTFWESRTQAAVPPRLEEWTCGIENMSSHLFSQGHPASLQAMNHSSQEYLSTSNSGLKISPNNSAQRGKLSAGFFPDSAVLK